MVKRIVYANGNIVVCLLVEEEVALARGIAICSNSDRYNSRGIVLASYRAMNAYFAREDSEPIAYSDKRKASTLALSLARDQYGTYKATYRPALTNTEKLLIDEAISSKPMSIQIDRSSDIGMPTLSLLGEIGIDKNTISIKS